MEEEARSATRNQKIHIQSLSATKLGDGLVNPKLVLSWLLTSLGAGAFWVGLLVPVREAGALLPQLFTANWLRRFTIRKWWWVTGSVVQGLAVFVMVASAWYLSGDVAGVTIVAALAIFALARSICSVSYKDVLGKTVVKPKRGLVTGTASAVAAGGVLLFGILLIMEVVATGLLVRVALTAAGGLWFVAAWRFMTLHEEPSVIENTTGETHFIRRYVGYLRRDRELQKFLLVRGLLIATAIAPPYMILLAESSAANMLSQLGALVVAASFATFVSGRLWGKLADRSTPLVLGYSGLASAAFLFIAWLGASFALYETVWFLPFVLFGVMVSYQGVRIARSVHLVNLANEETRAAYTAISNTIIGIALLGTGLFGWLAEATSVALVMIVLLVMSAAGGGLGFWLKKP